MNELTQLRQLDTQLHHEQCLNHLGQCLNREVMAVLDNLACAECTTVQAETAIFKALAQQLSIGLGGEGIAIALPTSSDRLTSQRYTIRHIASRQQRSMHYLVIGGLASGKLLRLGIGKTLTDADIQHLKTAIPESVWILADPEGVLGWLFACPSSSMPQQHLDWQIDELRSRLIERAIQQGIMALRQIWAIRKSQQTQQELIQSNKLKSEFLANTSHEIRTPLSSILGFTHLLREQGYSSTNLRHQEYLNIILSSGQHLLALINDILDLSKVEANQLDLQWESVEVESVCQMALTLIREQASNKGLTLHLDIAPTMHSLVADALRLKQMLFNLLSNAVKFTHQGKVGLRVIQNDRWIHFTVWDTGIGISPEQQALLFRPYAQLNPNDATHGERHRGTGLGLALTQKLAELHGGWIDVRSELNRGSHFTIVLPLVIPSQPDAIEYVVIPAVSHQLSLVHSNAPETRLSPVSSAIADTPSPHLMLVEDNIYNAKLMRIYLKKRGYDVTWVKDGAEMWQALEISLPILILMDIHLPGVDGLTLTRQLKADDRYRAIPVIAQTAMAMAGDRDTCLEAGAIAYIPKPIDLDLLGQLLTRHSGIAQG